MTPRGQEREIRRGDIWSIALDPTIGREIQKQRPCLIIQNDIGNRYGGTTIVAPLTSTVLTGPVFVPVEPTAENGLKNLSYINAAQIRCVDQSRLVKRFGHVDTHTLEAVRQALIHSLGL